MNIVLEAIIVFFITIFILVTVIIIKKKVIDKSKSNIPETSTCPPYFSGPTCNVSGFMPSNIMEVENQPYPPGGSIIKLKYFPERSWTEYGFTKSARIFTAKDDISIKIKNITNISSNPQATACLYAIVDNTTTSSPSDGMAMMDISYEPVWGVYNNDGVGKLTGVKAIAINDSLTFKINNGLVTLLLNDEVIVVYDKQLNPEKQYRFAIVTLDLIEGTISAKIE
jgi:hypothetical protein